MKILSVKVDDPGHKGYANSPELHVHVDTEPAPTGEIEYVTTADGSHLYAYRHFGPFVKFVVYSLNEKKGNMRGALDLSVLGGPSSLAGGAWSSRAGAFNVEVMPDKHVADVYLRVGDDDMIWSGWSLEIDRAARELKKHDPEWRLGINEQAAKMGDITWTPEEMIPRCLWRGQFGPSLGHAAKICGKAAYHPFMGRPMGLCDECKVAHDQVAATQRAKAVR